MFPSQVEGDCLPTSHNKLPQSTLMNARYLALQIAQEADATKELFNALKQHSFVRTLKVTQQDLQWALNCAHSRSFAVPRPFGKPLLMPLHKLTRSRS